MEAPMRFVQLLSLLYLYFSGRMIDLTYYHLERDFPDGDFLLFVFLENPPYECSQKFFTTASTAPAIIDIKFSLSAWALFTSWYCHS